MVSTKTKVIGAGTTILTLTSLILWMVASNQFKLEVSGDITCSGNAFYSEVFRRNISDCQIFWNVTSINATYKFSNKNNTELNFSPKVNGYDCYIKDGRYKTGYRPLDKTWNLTYRYGVKYEFMCFVFKETRQTVKWSLFAADKKVDPILFGINISIICDSKTKKTNKTIYYFEEITKEYTCNGVAIVNNSIKTGFCYTNQTNTNGTRNLTFSHKFNSGNLTNKTIYWQENITLSYVDYINATVCPPTGFKDETRGRSFYCSKCDFNCYLRGEYVIMENNNDLNTGCAYHIPTGKSTCRFDSDSIKRRVKENCYEVET